MKNKYFVKFYCGGLDYPKHLKLNYRSILPKAAQLASCSQFYLCRMYCSITPAYRSYLILLSHNSGDLVYFGIVGINLHMLLCWLRRLYLLLLPVFLLHFVLMLHSLTIFLIQVHSKALLFFFIVLTCI